MLFPLPSYACFALVLAGVAASAPLSSTSAHNGSTPTPTLHWTSCPGVNLSTVQCANFSAPLNYSSPSNGTITLSLSRLKTNKTSSLGNLHFNPGGPGVSALQTVIEFAYAHASGIASLPPGLIENYDIIGLDPRGVGSSTPLRCDPDVYNLRVPVAATSAPQFDALKAKNQALGESCRRLSGPVFDHLSTVNVARDLDLARAALGDEKLNFLGLSYGSQLGAQYLELFPERAGRVVLDGIADHSNGNALQLNNEAAGYERTLANFFDWCDEHAAECAISTGRKLTSAITNVTTTISSPAAVWDAIIASASATSIPAPDCTLPSSSSSSSSSQSVCYSNMTADEFRLNAQYYLFSVHPTIAFSGWSTFSQHLAETAEGNATFFSTPLATTPTSALFATNAISLADWPGVHSAQDITQLLIMGVALYPRTAGFASSLSIQTQRPGWPAKLENPPHMLDREQMAKAPPVLLVQSFWDPACGLPWAVNVRGQMAQGSALLLRRGSGHTSVLNGGEVGMVAGKFLVDGDMPGDGVVYKS